MYKITFCICFLVLGIHKGYFVVKSWCEMLVFKISDIKRNLDLMLKVLILLYELVSIYEVKSLIGGCARLFITLQNTTFCANIF